MSSQESDTHHQKPTQPCEPHPGQPLQVIPSIAAESTPRAVRDRLDDEGCRPGTGHRSRCPCLPVGAARDNFRHADRGTQIRRSDA
ncbi:hypothetical protein [Ornithinimicrobium kibberense]|uniref:hypothetical protein n=1 Tax=Ornithinimicrobium kibberense TaxID=282060 RepID=UPI00362416DA